MSMYPRQSPHLTMPSGRRLAAVTVAAVMAGGGAWLVSTQVTQTAPRSSGGAQVVLPPTADFSSSSSVTVPGSAVGFDASASRCGNAPCTYTWSGEDASGSGRRRLRWSLGRGAAIHVTFHAAGTKH